MLFFYPYEGLSVCSPLDSPGRSYPLITGFCLLLNLIVFIFCLVGAIFCAVGALLLVFGFKITKDVVDKAQREIDARNA